MQEHWDTLSYIELFSEKRPNIKKLSLSLPIQDEQTQNLLVQLIATNLPNLERLKTHGTFVTDLNTKLLKNLSGLKSFKLLTQDNSYYGLELKHLNPLQCIELYPYNIEYSSMYPLLANSSKCLSRLKIDCEIFGSEQITQLISLLESNNIQKLYLSYCEKMSVQSLQKIC